ncbi:MAG: hypothetical protein LUE98_19085 [Tannerellaceae bacterium]|nr:hypothetical protein [Tannerellaceae bacterium]
MKVTLPFSDITRDFRFEIGDKGKSGFCQLVLYAGGAPLTLSEIESDVEEIIDIN